jgi:high-affinity nickel-transport protein
MTTTCAETGLRQRLGAFWRSLNRRDWTSLGGMAGFILLLTWSVSACSSLVMPHHYQLGGDHPVFTVGSASLRTFGLRPSTPITSLRRQHHPQADGRQRRPGGQRNAAGEAASRLSGSGSPRTDDRVPLAFLLSVGVKALAGQVEDEVRTALGHRVIGARCRHVPWILGILNPRGLLGIIKVFRGMRSASTTRASSKRS